VVRIGVDKSGRFWVFCEEGEEWAIFFDVKELIEIMEFVGKEKITAKDVFKWLRYKRRMERKKKKS